MHVSRTQHTVIHRAVVRWMLIAIAVAAYVLVIASGINRAFEQSTNALQVALTVGLFGIALIGSAVALTPQVEAGRLGARAQAQQRRYRTLALVAAALALVVNLVGMLVSGQEAWRSCIELPVCLSSDQLAQVQMAHRVVTVPLGLLTVLLAFQSRRLVDEPLLRWLANLAFGTTLVQSLVGMLQLVALGQPDALLIGGVRVAHLALGTLAWGLLAMLATIAVRRPLLFPVVAEVAEVPAAPAAPATRRFGDVLKDYVSLTKPGVISLLILTTIISMYITPAGIPDGWLVFWTAVGGWLMAASAHSFNCYLDRDIDILMGRTGRRPIPSGRIPAWHALVLGAVLGIAALIILLVFANWLAAAMALAGHVYYVFIYTMWLKRSTPQNIVIGGGAGAFPPLVGWAAAAGSLSLPSLFLFAIIFYWTPPHFWALALIRRNDYARAGVPMLPVVAGEHETKRQIVLYTLLMFVLTILPTPLQMMGVPYLIAALVLGGIFTYYALRVQREGTTAAAWGLYKYSLLYLALLFAAMLVDRVVFA